jgi:hypothetical protein
MQVDDIPKVFTGVLPWQASALKRFSCAYGEVTEKEAFELIGAALKDDTHQGHITVIDVAKARREQARKNWETIKVEVPKAADVRFQVYDPSLGPSKEMLAPNNLASDKQFRDGGRVLLAQRAQKPGEQFVDASRWYDEADAKTLREALRKIAPDLLPKDPLAPLMPSIPSIPWDGLMLAVCALVLIVAVAKNHQG